MSVHRSIPAWAAVLLGASTVLTGGVAPARAQSPSAPWPARPIRLLVPQTPSGQVDTVARTVAQSLSERLGQAVVVENRAGANGAIAHEAIAKAAPDGYNLLMTSQSAMVFNMSIHKSNAYDPLRDFTQITLLFDTPYYLVVNAGVPARSVLELVALARAQPGKLNFATVGIGSGQHLYMEVFKSMTGINLVHVPYKGSNQAGTDLLSGQVQVMLQGSGFTVPQSKSGKIRVLASTGAQRTHAMPDLPTVAESGVPGYTASTWYGLAGPARLPRPITDRLLRETGEILRQPALREKFAAFDIFLTPSTPEEMTERIRTEIPLFGNAARQAGIEPE